MRWQERVTLFRLCVSSNKAWYKVLTRYVEDSASSLENCGDAELSGSPKHDSASFARPQPGLEAFSCYCIRQDRTVRMLNSTPPSLSRWVKTSKSKKLQVPVHL